MNATKPRLRYTQGSWVPLASAPSQLNGADPLRQRIKAGFVAQGTTYTKWCREHGVNRSNCNAALAGAWDGPKAKALRSQVLMAAGVQCA